MSNSERICVGAIAGAFGVQGEVRIKSFCSEPEDIANYAPLSTEDGTRVFEITLTRPLKNGLGARIAGVATKEQADALRGTTLWADRGHLPSLPDDEFYHADLIGLQVVDTGGAKIGTVHAVHNHGAGDILEITAPSLKQALLLPFTKAIVPTVDLSAGRIVIDPPDEM
ncbi:16S rRNA processing protein RimM [Thioclava sp. BHET1]|nr:16S rRNA processing protein RimM [Thioclava sp. BHET1]